MFTLTKVAANSKYVKKINRIAVLNIVKENESISRQKLSKLTGLTPPAITKIVRELVSRGLITEDGLGRSNGGRKPVRLKFNAKAGFVIGIEITRREATIGIADLESNLIKLQKCTKDMSNPREAALFLVEKIESLMRSKEMCGEKLLGIGVAFPGLLFAEQGTIKRSVNLGRQWDNFPLRAAIEEKLGLTVFVESNANASALAERWFGGGTDCRDLVYINLGEGISAGILIDDRIIRGFQGHAGELGHIMIQKDGNLCNCGNRGCLESVCGIAPIVQKTNEELPYLKSNDPLKKLWEQKGWVDIEEIIANAHNKDFYAWQTMCELGKHIGIGVSNLVNLYNPEVVFIGGKLAAAGEVLLPSLRETVRAHSFPEIASATRVEISKLNSTSGVIGACALALKELFRSEHSVILQENNKIPVAAK